MSKTKELGEKIEAAEQERLDKLEAFDSHMRLTRRLDETQPHSLQRLKSAIRRFN